jgi:DNA (cytosine-5)-methyltransferase 1
MRFEKLFINPKYYLVSMNFIDLFAGAGGMSEGFIREGFHPIAHVEMSKEACETLKTRIAYHYFNLKNQIHIYEEYLKNLISKDDLLLNVPIKKLDSVIQCEISSNTVHDIFKKIDSLRQRKKIDVIIGGPPCQAYSVAGRSRDPNGMKRDQRNFLFRHYGDFLAYYKPKFFVFENVLGLLSAGNAKYFQEMMLLFKSLGYSIDYKVINAEDCGVLQKRRRVIIIGKRAKFNFIFPEIKKAGFSGKVKRDLFSDLPFLSPGDQLDFCNYTKPSNSYLRDSFIRDFSSFVTQHTCRMNNIRDLEIYAIVINKWLLESKRLKYSELPKRLIKHNNLDSFLDRYKVIDPNGFSHTIVAHIAKDGHYYIYPDAKQIRSISVREAARLQSFPDNYYFEGGRTAAYKQIGNAVPPLMAQAIAKTLKKL